MKFLFCLNAVLNAFSQESPLFSPDKNLQVKLKNEAGRLYYSFAAYKKWLIDYSYSGKRAFVFKGFCFSLITKTAKFFLA